MRVMLWSSGPSAMIRGYDASAGLRHSDTAWLGNTAASTVPVAGPLATRMLDLFPRVAERINKRGRVATHQHPS